MDIFEQESRHRALAYAEASVGSDFQPTLSRSELLRYGLFGCIATLMVGCGTSLPAFRSVEAKLPPLKQGYARVYLYCVQPSSITMNSFRFSIDDKHVGGQVGSFNLLYVDHIAGPCKVSVERANGIPFLEPSADLMLNLEAGETRYVQAEMVVRFPLPVAVRLIISDPAQAASDVRKCFYIGPALTQSQTS